MRLKYTILIFATLLGAFSCSKQVEPRTIAGYIIDTTNSNQIILNAPDSIPARRTFTINDNTIFTGGVIVEGNIAEVIYLPSDDESHPTALNVTADVTYPRIIGRWRSHKDEDLQIDILLQPHGRITQSAPASTLIFQSWQLTGEENTITLHGSLSLPPKKQPKEKGKEIIEEENMPQTAPARQQKLFSVTARLAYDEEGNTEQHKVLIITTDKGDTSKLYPAWE